MLRMVISRYLLLAGCMAACLSPDAPTVSSTEGITPATSEYTVLAQKALTYQADFRLNDWAGLLADDVEYQLPAGDSLRRLRGKVAILAHWQAWKDRWHVKEVRLSGFTILPMYSSRTLPLANLPGVYVPVICRQRVTYASGRVRDQPMCLWMHFNDQKLIDRLYGFES
jgi:hypothetical protein